MTKRGAKSHTTIAGHTLTWAELTVLNQLQDYVKAHTSDDTRIPLLEIFPDRGKRHAARHLAEVGVLPAVGIEIIGFDVVVSKGQTTP